MCLNPYLGQFKCRHCKECLLEKKHDYLLRSLCEYRVTRFHYLITLTYDNEHVMDFYQKTKSGKDNMQVFLSRFRKYYVKLNFGDDATFKYVYCSEQGHSHNRPHWHLLLFSNSKLFNINKFNAKSVNKSFANIYWKKGNVKIEICKSEKAVSYVSKYIYKSFFDDSLMFCKSPSLHNDIYNCLYVRYNEQDIKSLSTPLPYILNENKLILQNIDYDNLLTIYQRKLDGVKDWLTYYLGKDYKLPIVKTVVRCSKNMGWNYVKLYVPDMMLRNKYELALSCRSNGKPIVYYLSSYYLNKIYPVPPQVNWTYTEQREYINKLKKNPLLKPLKLNFKKLEKEIHSEERSHVRICMTDELYKRNELMRVRSELFVKPRVGSYRERLLFESDVLSMYKFLNEHPVEHLISNFGYTQSEYISEKEYYDLQYELLMQKKSHKKKLLAARHERNYCFDIYDC